MARLLLCSLNCSGAYCPPRVFPSSQSLSGPYSPKDIEVKEGTQAGFAIQVSLARGSDKSATGIASHATQGHRVAQVVRTVELAQPRG